MLPEKRINNNAHLNMITVEKNHIAQDSQDQAEK